MSQINRWITVTGMIVLFLLAASPGFGLEPSAYRVVVNESNPMTRISRAELSRYFLKQVTQWGNGGKVSPVDLPETSDVRAAFTREIHGKNVGAVKSYWQRLIFSGRGVPPPEKARDAEVISFVRENPGALGYISMKTALDGVKTVEIGD